MLYKKLCDVQDIVEVLPGLGLGAIIVISGSEMVCSPSTMDGTEALSPCPKDTTDGKEPIGGG